MVATLRVVYIVNVTDDLGGAEKRFVGLWLHLARAGRRRVHLVVSSALREKLAGVPEFTGLERFDHAIETYPSEGGLKALRRCLLGLWRRDPRAVFHYVHVSPVLVQLFPSRRTLFSMTAATWRYTNRTGIAIAYAGMLAAGHVDVLNEPVYRGLARTLRHKRSALSLTPGSFVDLDFYRPAPFHAKGSRLTFLGLFSRDKGIFQLLRVLPELDARLRDRGVEPEYRFMGRDVEKPGVAELVGGMRPSIDVQAYEEADPARVLSASKVFFSLQQTTNYPSKSLLEALACGNLPIVTDVPDSRRIAPDDFAFYVPRAFTAESLATHAIQILTMPQDEFEAKVALARAHLRRRFSVETMADYYLDLYDRLGGARA